MKRRIVATTDWETLDDLNRSEAAVVDVRDPSTEATGVAAARSKSGA